MRQKNNNGNISRQRDSHMERSHQKKKKRKNN